MNTTDFLEGMSRAACTVSIVTSEGQSGKAGVTVSAMTSVSVDGDDHSLLVCVHHLSPACEVIRDNRAFCVNVLRQNQSDISDTFAGRIKMDNGDKFSCSNWRVGAAGGLVLENALVSFDCHLKHHFQWGSHYVFIGHAAEVILNDPSPALIYANRSYGKATPLAALNRPQTDQFDLLNLNIGCFVTLGPYFLPSIVKQFHDSEPDVILRLMEGNQNELLERLKDKTIDAALTYDFDLPKELETHYLGRISPYVLLSSKDSLANQPEVSLKDLEKKPMVVLDLPPSRDYFVSLFSDFDLNPTIQYHSSSFEMVRGLVGQGLGFSLLATRPAGDVTYDGNALVAKPLLETVEASSILIATLKGEGSSDLAQKFIRQCRDFFTRLEIFS